MYIMDEALLSDSGHTEGWNSEDEHSTATSALKLDTPAAKGWSLTKIKQTCMKRYIWTIQTFSIRSEETGESFTSPTFSAGGDSNWSKWCLELYPKGENKESDDHLSLYLRLVSCSGGKVRAKYKFSILNSKCREVNMLKSKRVRQFREKEVNIFVDRKESHKARGFSKFISIASLLSQAHLLLPDDNLTITCEVSVVTDSVNISGLPNSVQYKIPDSCLSNDLGDLLMENQEFSDVTLFAKGREFKVHKAVLAARSRVFQTMFKKETEQNRMNISEINYEVLEEMIRFIYTENVLNLEKIASDLLAAADTYELERLKIMCEETLCNNIAVEDAAELLILANVHNSNQLKTRAIDFINTHAKDVIDTPGWKLMKQTHPHAIAEVYESLVMQETLGTP